MVQGSGNRPLLISNTRPQLQLEILNKILRIPITLYKSLKAALTPKREYTLQKEEQQSEYTHSHTLCVFSALFCRPSLLTCRCQKECGSWSASGLCSCVSALLFFPIPLLSLADWLGILSSKNIPLPSVNLLCVKFFRVT